MSERESATERKSESESASGEKSDSGERKEGVLEQGIIHSVTRRLKRVW